MAVTNSGKAAEKAVQAALKSIDSPHFDWQRMYDSTSARNGFMAQVGDFEFFLPRTHGVLEVKSTKHDYRLTKGAFSDNQRVRLLQRIRAGGKVWVIIHHWVKGVWRCLPYQSVHEAFTEQGLSSMDLRTTETFDTADEAVFNVISLSMEEVS